MLEVSRKGTLVGTIAESGAVTRYLAKLAGLMPADDLEAAKADMIYERFRDLRSAFDSAKYSGKSDWNGDDMAFTGDPVAHKAEFAELKKKCALTANDLE